MKKILIILTALFLVSCYGIPQQRMNSSNSEFEVQLLFEQAGGKHDEIIQNETVK